jgi:hypothetical protein
MDTLAWRFLGPRSGDREDEVGGGVAPARLGMAPPYAPYSQSACHHLPTRCFLPLCPLWRYTAGAMIR